MKNEGHLGKNQPVKRDILRPNFERFEKKNKNRKHESNFSLKTDYATEEFRIDDTI